MGLYYFARAPEICNVSVYFRNKLKVVLGKVIEVHFYGGSPACRTSVGKARCGNRKKNAILFLWETLAYK